MQNEVFTHLDAEKIKELGFIHEQGNIYSNGEYSVEYSGYGLAIIYASEGDSTPVFPVLSIEQL